MRNKNSEIIRLLLLNLASPWSAGRNNYKPLIKELPRQDQEFFSVSRKVLK
jgi:hypothetical protein